MPKLMVIPDNETNIDLLYYEAIAKTIVQLIDGSLENPLTVGVHGDWGAGKSSILMMLEKEYENDDSTLCIRFNGWLFQGFEDTKTVLIETIIQGLTSKRKLSATAKKKVEDVLKRVDWMKVARKTGGLAFTVATGIPTLDQAKDIIAGAKSLLQSSGDISRSDFESAFDGTGGFLKPAKTDSMPTQIHAFREDFIELLSEAKIKQLIVVVDDLDRCLPETAIETLEAIRLFLFVPGAAFVIAADEAMIEYAVRKHFPDLPASTGPASYARNYLEKLIQVPFRLPPLGYVESRTYITLLLTSLELDPDDERFVKLTNLTREVLRRPWGGDGFNRDTIAKALGSVPEEVETALQLADQIAPLLTDGAHGNPRQIKRFLNTMTLRLAIAAQRGISDDIKPMVLAKLMLAERFETRLFEQIEREASVGGSSSTIAELESSRPADAEAAEGDNESPKKTTKKSIAKAANDAEQGEWTANEWVRRWASTPPKFGTVDLRPYLFVSRDRKALFTSGSLTAIKEDLVNKLCGSQMGARAAAAEVAKLSSGEVEQIFNQIAKRISSTSNLKSKPDGIDGIKELCKIQPALQSPTVALLATLPVKSLGPWIVAGWNEAITSETANGALVQLMKSWEDQDENPLLRGAIRIKKGNV